MTHTSRIGVLAGCVRWFIIAGSFAFGGAQAAGHDDIEALRRDIDALKKGQDAVAADVLGWALRVWDDTAVRPPV